LRQHLGDLAAYVHYPAIVDQTGDFLLACIGSEDRYPGWTELAPEHMPILFFQARLKPQPILEDCAAARFQRSALDAPKFLCKMQRNHGEKESIRTRHE
jgi:hypothetical protein